MTNIAFRDKKSNTIKIYSKNQNFQKNERIKEALKELKYVGNIVIYLYKGNKLRIINNKGY
jgi:hypothetical protein